VHSIGTLGFLGYGNMGSAILEGLIEKGVITGKHALVYDPSPVCMEKADQLGAALADSPAALAAGSGALVLAVKPQMMEQALEQIKPSLKSDALIISIAAGLPIAFFEKHLGADKRIVRVMPNTPAMVNAGAAGIALSAACSPEDGAIVKRIFEAVGVASIVEEKFIDVVTALSGSGPAYFFYLTECMIDAAVELGLEPHIAHKLAVQTLLGSGMLLAQSGEPPQVLRSKVTSPGGTTEAAIKQFKCDDFEAAVSAAMAAAVHRAHELGKQ
jgi:pyrroline-5-carboxylate reductase